MIIPSTATGTRASWTWARWTMPDGPMAARAHGRAYSASGEPSTGTRTLRNMTRLAMGVGVRGRTRGAVVDRVYPSDRKPGATGRPVPLSRNRLDSGVVG